MRSHGKFQLSNKKKSSKSIHTIDGPEVTSPFFNSVKKDIAREKSDFILVFFIHPRQGGEV